MPLADVVSRFPRLLAQDQRRLCRLPLSQFTSIRLRPAMSRGFRPERPAGARFGIKSSVRCYADFRALRARKIGR